MFFPEIYHATKVCIFHEFSMQQNYNKKENLFMNLPETCPFQQQCILVLHQHQICLYFSLDFQPLQERKKFISMQKRENETYLHFIRGNKDQKEPIGKAIKILWVVLNVKVCLNMQWQVSPSKSHSQSDKPLNTSKSKRHKPVNV